ncbi:hypothetical protein PL8927_600061 [Planktothrix serta PCC 8927]|uniref:Uncharacterized protein n=1 Tax=Planktothrix serta PCC 8927 TaxID=671068 RepID=A0A7Z9DY76_9CYAN|nr:hypothetical protein PL8927_600061 [Planktothrix serta PCC 8927]
MINFPAPDGPPVVIPYSSKFGQDSSIYSAREQGTGNRGDKKIGDKKIGDRG